jgi:hypothetical protein
MGLFKKKQEVIDPRYIELNEILAQSLINSKVPEGVDKETYELIGKIVFQANTYAEELKAAMGFCSEGHVKKFIKEAFEWVSKDNLNLIGKRAIERIK